MQGNPNNPDLALEALQGVKIELTRPNPVCAEFGSTLARLGIPIGEELSKVMNQPETKVSVRCGGAFALTTGKLIAGPIKHGVENIDQLDRLFGIGHMLGREIDIIRTELENTHPDLEWYEIEDILEPKLHGIFQQTMHQAGVSNLNVDRPVFTTKSAGVLWDLAHNAVYSEAIPPDVPSFNYFPTKANIRNCKDSEHYLAITQAKSRRPTGARVHVFYDPSTREPVLYQKAGTNHIDEDGLNATCINLKPIAVNGILLPVGTLCGVSANLPNGYYLRNNDGSHPLTAINGLTPVRLTMFGTPQEELPLAFGLHYESFVISYVHNHGSVPTIEDFVARAEAIIMRDDVK